jgi:hypothetical protein
MTVGQKIDESCNHVIKHTPTYQCSTAVAQKIS